MSVNSARFALESNHLSPDKVTFDGDHRVWAAWYAADRHTDQDEIIDTLSTHDDITLAGAESLAGGGFVVYFSDDPELACLYQWGHMDSADRDMLRHLYRYPVRGRRTRPGDRLVHWGLATYEGNRYTLTDLGTQITELALLNGK